MVVDKYTVVGKVVHGIDGVNMSYCAFVVGFGNTSNLYLGPSFGSIMIAKIRI